MSLSTVVFVPVLMITVPVAGLTFVVLCAMRGATPAQRAEILRAAVPLARAWLRQPLIPAMPRRKATPQRVPTARKRMRLTANPELARVPDSMVATIRHHED